MPRKDNREVSWRVDNRRRSKEPYLFVRGDVGMEAVENAILAAPSYNPQIKGDFLKLIRQSRQAITGFCEDGGVISLTYGFPLTQGLDRFKREYVGNIFRRIDEGVLRSTISSLGKYSGVDYSSSGLPAVSPILVLNKNYGDNLAYTLRKNGSAIFRLKEPKNEYSESKWAPLGDVYTAFNRLIWQFYHYYKLPETVRPSVILYQLLIERAKAQGRGRIEDPYMAQVQEWRSTIEEFRKSGKEPKSVFELEAYDLKNPPTSDYHNPLDISLN